MQMLIKTNAKWMRLTLLLTAAISQISLGQDAYETRRAENRLRASLEPWYPSSRDKEGVISTYRLAPTLSEIGRLNLSIGADNHGSPFTNGRQLHMGAGYGSIISEMDAIVSNYSRTFNEARDDDWVVSAGYFLPFTWEKQNWITVVGGYNDVRSHFGSEGWFMGLELGHEFYSQNDHHVDLVLGTTWRTVQSSNFILSSNFSDSNVTLAVWSVGFRYRGPEVDRMNGYSTVEFRHDFSRAGKYGSDDEDEIKRGNLFTYRDPAAEGSFGIYKLQLERLQRLHTGEFRPGKLLLVAKLQAQYADDSLPIIEQKYIGGNDTVRGYPVREFFGDSGINGTLELRSPFWVGSTPSTHCIFKIFADFGYIDTKHPGPGDPKSEDMLGVGVGVTYQYKRFIGFNLDVAFPTNETRDSHSGEIHVSGTIQY